MGSNCELNTTPVEEPFDQNTLPLMLPTCLRAKKRTKRSKLGELYTRRRRKLTFKRNDYFWNSTLDPSLDLALDCAIYFAQVVPEAMLRSYLTLKDFYLEGDVFPDSGYVRYKNLRVLLFNYDKLERDLQLLILRFIESFTPEDDCWRDNLMQMQIYYA